MGHGMKYIIRHGNEVNHGTWECSKIMGHGNEVNHGTWELMRSWDVGMREITGHGKEENYEIWNEVHNRTWE